MEKWQQAAELLNKGHYEQVGQLLQVQQEAAQRSGQLATAVFLAAASQLCLTCLQFRAERELHQLGLDEALRREHELRQQIQGVLALLSSQAPLETQADLEAAFNLPPTQSILDGPEEPDSEKQPNLLQKIQQRLGFELALASGKQEAKAGHQYPQAEQEPAPPTQTDKKIVSAPNDQDERPSTSQLQEQYRPTLPLSQAETELLQSAIDSLIGPEHQKADSLPTIDPEALVLESRKEKTPPIEEEPISEVSGTSPEIALLRSVMNMMDEPTDKPESSLLFPEDELLVVKAERAHKRGLEKDSISDASPEGKDDSEAIRGEVDGERIIPEKQSGPLVLPAIVKDTIVRVHEHGDSSVPSLVVYCLGPFRVYQNDQLVSLWTGQKGLSILKYLVANRGEPVSKDVLMDAIWPETDAEAARRNLHQAIYSLRQALRPNGAGFQHILFQNDNYLMNPEMAIWIDFVEFERQVRIGRRLAAESKLKEMATAFSIAEGLYQGEFMKDDLYEEWASLQREQIRNTYLEITDRLSAYYADKGEYSATIALCQKILAQDNCFEAAHRRLMQSYLSLGQRHLAVRQYHTCEQLLKAELDIAPSQEITALYKQIVTYPR